MAKLGLRPEDFAADELSTAFEVWPDNWPALSLFQRLRTQWRVGPGGAYGLDYDTALNLMPRMQVKPDEELDLLDDLRVMESAALAEIHKDRK